MLKAKGSAGQLKGRDSSGGSVVEQLENTAPTLSEIGIDRKTSMRVQRLAALLDSLP